VGGYQGSSTRIVQLAIHLNPGKGYQPNSGSMFGQPKESMTTEESDPHSRLIQKREHPVRSLKEVNRGQQRKM
jgi:hypothetical protein